MSSPTSFRKSLQGFKTYIAATLTSLSLVFAFFGSARAPEKIEAFGDDIAVTIDNLGERADGVTEIIVEGSPGLVAEGEAVIEEVSEVASQAGVLFERFNEVTLPLILAFLGNIGVFIGRFRTYVRTGA